MSGISPTAWIIIALALTTVLAWGLWFGLGWHKQKKARQEQADKMAARQEKRQKKRDDRHRVRQAEVSAVRSARAQMGH